MKHCKEICIDTSKYQLKSDGDASTPISLIMINRKQKILSHIFSIMYSPFMMQGNASIVLLV